jgi:thermitase
VTGRRARWAKASLVAAGGTVVASVSFLSGSPAFAAQYLGDQWGLSVIGAPTAWQHGTGGGVRIGIIDTGVDLAQQDLQGKVVAQNYFVSQPSSGCETSPPANPAQDDNGHGTHVSGIAAASGAVGVSGVAPGASLVVAKVLDCTGAGQYSDVVAGINWAVQAGAKVINLSLGNAPIGGLVDTSNIEGSPLGTALQNAWNSGAVPVIAAGNNSDGLFGLGDANYSGVPAVVVAATGSPQNGEQGQLASYSNGVNEAQWGVAAPGGDDPNGPSPATCGQYDPYEILSTYWTASQPTNCYATDEGTSMATPFVSGTVALLLSHGVSASQAVQTLLGTANHSVSCGSDCSGLVNAAAAVQAVAGAPSPSAGPKTPSSSAPAPRAATAPSRPTSSAPAPTSTTAAPPSSTTPTTAPHRRALHDAGLAGGASGHGSPLWILLPVLLGIAVLSTLGVVGRRWWMQRRAAPVTLGGDSPGNPLASSPDAERAPPSELSRT